MVNHIQRGSYRLIIIPDLKNLNKFMTEHERLELLLSIDVIYHLLEDDVFEEYMSNLFSISNKYVIIYSCDDYDNINNASHVKQRKFTEYVDNKYPQWSLFSFIKNEYPFDKNNPNITSWSDFYIYRKSN